MLWICLGCSALYLSAANKTIDFKSSTLNKTPTGFTSHVSGTGPVGSWAVLEDAVPTLFKPFTENSPSGETHKVLAQTSRDITDERFPLLIDQSTLYSDFELKAQIKMVGGATEQMAGIAFRIQDENNYYIIRASSLGNTVMFYKFEDGKRSQPISVNVKIEKDVWYELSIECRGNQINCKLNDRPLFPTLNDSSFNQGKLGFWTKSDSVSYFGNVSIKYKPKTPPAVTLIKNIMEKQKRLEGLKILAVDPDNEDQIIQIIASSSPDEIGEAADEVGKDVLENGEIYIRKEKKIVVVTLPLKDRNGDTMAAVEVTLKRFLGQTQKTTITRATLIVKLMQEQVNSFRDLFY